MFGLPGRVLQLLRDYFVARPEIVKVVLYGSRAMGTETPGSDVDLAIVTTSNRDLSGAVKMDLEDLSTPYIFDVIDYQKITHEPLRAHIDRVGKVIFQR
jgi:predicted nucleotidyltransferase